MRQLVLMTGSRWVAWSPDDHSRYHLQPPAPEGWIAGTWTIDPAHTMVSFAVRHLMSRVRGTFSEVSGQIITRPDPSRSTAAATIAVSSVGTAHEMRDNHLRSAD